MTDLGNKEVFAKNLRLIMKVQNKERNQVCSDLGFKYTTFADWYHGKKYPRIDKIESLANYFGIQKSDLIENKSDFINKENNASFPPEAIPYAPTGYAPILGSIPAGMSSLAVEEIEGYSAVDVSKPEDCFWLRVNGDSMINAGISPGDLVLIRTQPCADNGQIVACRVNDDEATLKRFKLQGETVILLPENPNYEPIIVNCSDFENGYANIIGVALQVKRDL